MDALLREIRPSADGIAEYIDVEVTTDILTVGSAPDRTIQLLGNDVAPEHAELRLSKGTLELKCRGGHTVKFQGSNRASVVLKPGSEVVIGGNCLTFMVPPAGFDVGVQVQLDQNVDASVFEKAFRTDLHQGWFSIRGAAWLLSLVVVIVAFAAPFILTNTDFAGTSMADWLPDDKLWTSGPLHPAHVLATNNDCKTCHVEIFQRVQDSACQSCHTAIDDHVASDLEAFTHSVGPTPRCATCHRDHNEPVPHLVIRADALCTDCHANPEMLFADLEIEPVTGFSEAAHPPFDADLEKPIGSRAGTGLIFDWLVSVEPVKEAIEVSNLRFPHNTHLDPEVVTKPRDGSRLGCVDCHELSLDREHFVPVTMESRCVACHELTFDQSMPDRQLPHGQPLEVMLTLEGQYLRKFSDPNVPQEAVVRRRIPDRDNTIRECLNTAFACAAEAAANDIREQFTVRGCIGCHVVEEHPGSEIYARYQVHPVRLATDYFPAGRFDHYSHQSMKERTGDSACLYCHQAEQSSVSSDLLIPDIDTCTDCHTDNPVKDRVVLGCVNCHSYHPYSSGYTGTIETGQP